MPNNQDKAVKRYRKRLKRERWVRCEVMVRREDAPLVRKVAAILNDPERDTVARALIRERLEETPVSSLKSLLAAAPLEGIDIERPRDPGREIDLRCS